MTVVFDLAEQRKAALARCQSLISEMQNVKRRALPGTPEMARINGVLKGLRRNEARLSAGVRNAPAKNTG